MNGGLGRLARNSFVNGVVIVAPLIITLLIFRIVFGWAVGFVNPIVRETRLVEYTANIELAAQLITLGAIVVLITMVGLMAELSAGRRTLGNIGRFVDFLPLFRTVYGSVRQVATSLATRSSEFESVVYVEYPRPGVYSIGFVTGESPHGMEEVAGQEAFNVYLPASPNPTAGRMEMVPRDRIHPSELSVGQGIRLLMTTGASTRTAAGEEELVGDVDIPEGSIEAGPGPEP